MCICLWEMVVDIWMEIFGFLIKLFISDKKVNGNKFSWDELNWYKKYDIFNLIIKVY